MVGRVQISSKRNNSDSETQFFILTCYITAMKRAAYKVWSYSHQLLSKSHITEQYRSASCTFNKNKSAGSVSNPLHKLLHYCLDLNKAGRTENGESRVPNRSNSKHRHVNRRHKTSRQKCQKERSTVAMAISLIASGKQPSFSF